MTIRNTAHLIDKHEKCLEILEGISSLETRAKLHLDSINGFPGTFPRLRHKYIHDLDITNSAINRLWSRYDRINANV